MFKRLPVFWGILFVCSIWLCADVQLNNLVYKVDDFNNQILKDTCIVFSNPNSSRIRLTITSHVSNDPNFHPSSSFYLEPYTSEYHTLTETLGFGNSGNFGASGKLPIARQIPTLFPWPFDGYATVSEVSSKPFYAYCYHGNWEYNGPIGGDERTRDQHPDWPAPKNIWYELDLSLSFYSTFVQPEGKNCYILPWIDVWTPCAPAAHPGWDVTFKLLNYNYQYMVPKIKFLWVAGGSGSSAWYDIGLLPPAQNTIYGFRPGELVVSLTSILSQTDFWGQGLINICPNQKKFGGVAYVEAVSGMMLLNHRVTSLDH